MGKGFTGNVAGNPNPNWGANVRPGVWSLSEQNELTLKNLWNPEPPPPEIDFLVVGGGGGGGSSASASNLPGGGGGGAGGVILKTNISVVAGAYFISVGAGGAADTVGSNTVFSTYTGLGGGKGNNGSGGNGFDGGSGGGAGGYGTTGGSATQTGTDNIKQRNTTLLVVLRRGSSMDSI